MTPCRCGHEAVVHQHHRPGTDCSQCDCRGYRRDWRVILANLRRGRS